MRGCCPTHRNQRQMKTARRPGPAAASGCWHCRPCCHPGPMSAGLEFSRFLCGISSFYCCAQEGPSKLFLFCKSGAAIGMDDRHQNQAIHTRACLIRLCVSSVPYTGFGPFAVGHVAECTWAHKNNIKFLTSFDRGDIHQESWSWVGSRGWDCSE